MSKLLLVPSPVYKAGSQPLDLSCTSGSTLVCSSHACKCKTRVKVIDSGKHSSLLQYGKSLRYKTLVPLGLGMVRLLFHSWATAAICFKSKFICFKCKMTMKKSFKRLSMYAQRLVKLHLFQWHYVIWAKGIWPNSINLIPSLKQAPILSTVGNITDWANRQKHYILGIVSKPRVKHSVCSDYFIQWWSYTNWVLIYIEWI